MTELFSKLKAISEEHDDKKIFGDDSFEIFIAPDPIPKEYFQIDKHCEEFFNEITELSQKNFEEYGAAELSIEQFEELKKKVTSDFTIYSTFVSVDELGKFGLISLN